MYLLDFDTCIFSRGHPRDLDVHDLAFNACNLTAIINQDLIYLEVQGLNHYIIKHALNYVV